MRLAKQVIRNCPNFVEAMLSVKSQKTDFYTKKSRLSMHKHITTNHQEHSEVEIANAIFKIIKLKLKEI